MLKKIINHQLVNVIIYARKQNGNILITKIKLRLNVLPKVVVKNNNLNRNFNKYCNMIKDYLDGKVKSLNKIPIDLSKYTRFQKDVLMTAKNIAWGKVISYKKLAKIAGYPKAVRAVASVMRKNKFPLVIPCHRVISSNGDIGGYMGKRKGRFIELKKKLLLRENIV